MIGLLFGLATALAWAIGSILIKGLSGRLDPITLNAPRAAVGAVFLLLMVLVTGRASGFQDLSTTQVIVMIASMVIGGGLGDTFYIMSMSRIGLSRAYPIAETYPALTLALGLLFFDETTTPQVLVGLVLVVAGVMLLSRPDASQDVTARESNDVWGVALALLAAVCWAASGVILGAVLEGSDSLVVASIRLPALALLFWGVVGVRKTAPTLRILSRREWLNLIIGGLVGWGLGSLFFVMTLSEIGATRTSIITCISPLFALPICVLVLREPFKRETLIGTVLTVAGIVFIS